MTVDELKQRLAALPGTFTLSDTDLGIAAAQQLFDESLPNKTLTLTGAAAQADRLAATGTIALPGVGSGVPLNAAVSFTADASENVSGIEILVTLDHWQVATSYLTLDLSRLTELGFDAARLLLVAEPDVTGVTTADVGVEADLPFQTTDGEQKLTLRGLTPEAPPPEAPVPTSLWELEAEFEPGIGFGELAQLAVLGKGLPGSAFGMPARVPVADELQLTDLRIVFDMDSKVVVATSANVQIAESWKIVAGKCELERLGAAFTITYPLTAPRVSAALHGTLNIAGIDVTASLTVPSLQLVAQLDEPLDVDRVFAQYFTAAASIPIEVEWLMLTVDASSSSPQWQVGFGVGEGQPGAWTLVGDVSLDGVALEVSGAGGAVQSASLTASFALGETAQAVLGGSWEETAGWTLSGNTVSESGLHVGQLLDVFAEKLHAPLPAPLAGLDLTYVGMTVAVKGPSFTFQCKGDFPLGTASADFVVNIAVSGSPLTQTSTGTLAISIPHDGGNETMTFDVTFDKDPTKTTFLAAWADKPGLGLAEVASELGLDLSEIPPALLPVITSLALGYDSNGPVLALAVDTEDTKSVWATVGSGATREYFGSIAAATAFRLSQLPLVGHDVPASEDIGIDSFGLLAGSGALAAPLAAQVNALVTTADVKLQAIPAAGLYLTVAYQSGGAAEPPLTLTLAGGQQGGGAVQQSRLAAAPSIPPASGSPIAWMNLQRSFGPVELQRAGVSYAGGTLWLLLDGSLAVGPLQLALQDLGVGFVLGGKDPWAPQFRLDGLSVGYSEPPLTIAGSLTNLSPPGSSSLNFQGGVVVEAEAFTLEAFGYYGNGAGEPPNQFTSMFLFLEGGAEIGGPPFFFVTGFAGGFGYNSAVTLPNVEEVAKFPMIAALPGTPQYEPSALGGSSPSPLTVLNTLTSAKPPWITPTLGEFWGAAGITFTSFELVSSQALLVIEAGNKLSLALLGLSTARFPQEGPDIYAQVELELEARLEPAQGEFWFEAVLAPSSFVIDPACHLTGGFAFCIWFGPSTHAGDFVLTLGGYHPAFSPPSYYPTVPRLGFSWQLGGEVTVGGQAYFALTPSSFMLGGELDVTFQSGNLRAWLSAGADVIVHWSPFWFDAHIWISVGASYRLDLLLTTVTLSVEIGADLELWGPPTGGKVTVDWYVISFSIPFGSDGPHTSEADWSSIGQMLPASSASLSVKSGLTASAGSEPQPWIVRGGTFAFTTATPVPASKIVVGGSYERSFSTLDVRPLQATGLDSVHTLKITDAKQEDVSAAFAVEPVLADVPASLWGQPVEGERVPSADGQLVTEQAVGVTLTVKPAVTGETAGAVEVAGVLAHQDLDVPAAQLPVSPTATPEGPAAKLDPTALALVTGASGIASETGIAARSALLSGLAQAGISLAAGVNPATFSSQAGAYLSAEPMLAVAGS